MYNLQPIAFIRTPFPEKFGIPRQPGLVPAARASLTLEEPFQKAGVFDGLDGTTHVWLVFLFHQQPDDWQPKVRPPRLGGNEKRGVFATRSPRRPNRIGLSVVKLELVNKPVFQLEFSGVDILNNTPILDIKPYVPYSDIVSDAAHGFAIEPPLKRDVHFSQGVTKVLQGQKDLRELIEQVLSLDPRPGYHQDGRSYGTALGGHNVRWRVLDKVVLVDSIEATKG